MSEGVEGERKEVVEGERVGMRGIEGRRIVSEEVRMER